MLIIFFSLVLFIGYKVCSIWVRPAERKNNEKPTRPFDRTIKAQHKIILSLSVLFSVLLIILMPVLASFRHWIIEVGDARAPLVAVLFFIFVFAIACAHAWVQGDLSWRKNK